MRVRIGYDFIFFGSISFFFFFFFAQSDNVNGEIQELVAKLGSELNEKCQ